jgi:hypothetical protein
MAKPVEEVGSVYTVKSVADESMYLYWLFDN